MRVNKENHFYRKKTFYILLCILLLTATLFPQRRGREIIALRIEEPVTIDGLLAEPVWNKAPEASVFLQSHPYRDDPDKISTTVKVLYDESYLYVGFVCDDTEPGELIEGAVGADTDLRHSDSVYVLLEISSDPNNFLVYTTNIIGIRSDIKISKDGQTADYAWNGSWISFSQRTAYGWSAEIAVELSSLFEAPIEGKTLGLALSRVVPRLDSLFWSGQLDPAFKVDELEEMKVIEFISADAQKLAGTRLEITPYAMVEMKESKVSPIAGLDLKYNFSRQISGQLTAYPDFSTVEPDHDRVNLTPFELYLPEQRDYFREDTDMYERSLGLFYSKRIGDIYGGVRLKGDFGTSGFSLTSVQTKKDQFHDEDTANFSILRLKDINVFKALRIGFTAANKFISQQNRGTAGLEAELDLSNKLKFYGQFALSYGDFENGNTAFILGPSYDSDTFHVHLFYKQIGENFGDNANEVGFVPDDNRREFDSAINKTFKFNKGVFTEIRYISNYNIYWGFDGTMRSWQIDEGLAFDLRATNFVVSLLHTMEYKLNEWLLEPRIIADPDKSGVIKVYTRDFRNDRTKLTSEFFNGEWQQFSLSATVGHNYGSSFQMYNFSKKFQWFENFFSQYDFYHIHFSKESLHKTTSISVLKLWFYLNENLFGTVFLQSNRESKKWNLQVVCTYRFKPPFGLVQLIYQQGSPLFYEIETEASSVFLKLGYTF